MSIPVPKIKLSAIAALLMTACLHTANAAEEPLPGSIQTVRTLSCEEITGPDAAKLADALRMATEHVVEADPSSLVEALQRESSLMATTPSADTTQKDAAQGELAMARKTIAKFLSNPQNLPAAAELGAIVPGDTLNNSSISDVSRKTKKSVDNFAAKIADLKKFWESIDEYVDGDTLIAAVAARRKLADCAGSVLVEARKAAAIAKAAAPTSNETRVAELKLKDAEADAVHIAQRAIFDQPQLSLFLGPSFTIDGSDKFKTGGEISALYDGGAGSLGNHARLFTEFSYKTRGVVDTERASGAPATPIDVNDVIRSSPGLIRFSAGASTGITDRYSVAFTGGLSSIPGGGGGFSKPLRPHGQLGLLGRTFINESLYSRLTLGYAFDRYWINKTPIDPEDASAGTNTQKSYNRFVVEGLVLTTAATAPGGISGAGRLTLNTPINGKGPSEVRLSILATMNFLDFFNLLNPKP